MIRQRPASKEKKWLLDRIEAFEAKFRSISLASRDALIFLGEEANILDLNPAAEQMFGWKRREISGELVERIISEKDHLKLYNRIAQFVEQGPSGKLLRPFHLKGLRKNGSVFPVEITMSGFNDKGKWTFTTYVRDLSEFIKLQNDAHSSEEKYRLFLNSTPDGILGLDLNGRCTFANRASLKFLGFSDLDDILGRDIHGLTHHTQSDGSIYPHKDCRINLAFQYGIKVHTDDEVFWRADGTSFLAEYWAYPIKQEREILGCVVTFIDITERKKAQNAIEEQALRDPLTGLYHRRYFMIRLKEELLQAERTRSSLAVLLCDLDEFKAINKQWGHEAGDKTLTEVARQIKEFTRGSDIVFKWGDDEFGMILPNTHHQGALMGSERIRAEILKLTNKTDYPLDASFGIALYPDHGADPEHLIEVADRALFIAKKSGNKFNVGLEEYKLDEKIVHVVFQPIIQVQQNEALGEEALSRDAKGKFGITDFFKKYEAIGLLDDLKCICFSKQIKEAKRVGLKRVFLNVDSNMLNRLPMDPIPADMDVILEISELEALKDIDAYLSIARKWRDRGYKFALDDFGAGFVSLPFLAHLFPDYIKIDRSTLLQAVSSEKFKGFLKNLLDTLVHYSSEGIIAEGVETEEELQILKDIGIHFGQGYHFGKPRRLNGDYMDPAENSP